MEAISDWLKRFGNNFLLGLNGFFYLQSLLCRYGLDVFCNFHNLYLHIDPEAASKSDETLVSRQGRTQGLVF